ncbi:hypothetical protein ACJ2_34460 [Pantoea sp. QMID2]|nr:hypothetical protein ACJ3_15010 [Pantoea sp. QMID3]GME59745.1 hypothetical protein ACJ4_34380 [Pantoea sp. QMID4]GME61268.1 hypothetical protein ACJ2_34460 [Pantoea sp. QMID2]
MTAYLAVIPHRRQKISASEKTEQFWYIQGKGRKRCLFAVYSENAEGQSDKMSGFVQGDNQKIA